MEEYKIEDSGLNQKNKSIKLGFYYDKVYLNKINDRVEKNYKRD